MHWQKQKDGQQELDMSLILQLIYLPSHQVLLTLTLKVIGYRLTLGNKIQSVSNAIHQKTLRGGANFIVVSPEVATILESIPGYAASTDGDANNKSYAMGVQKAGLINNRYTVYKNPYQFENVILVGFRGSNFLETGAVYAPYVPLIMTPLVYDPKNFTPRKGVMTRYAKKMVRPEFYGKVIVADVNYV